MEWIGRTTRAVRWRARNAVTAVRRAWAEPGRERDVVAQAGRATLAAIAEGTTARPAESVTTAYADFLRETAHAVHLYAEYRFAADGRDEATGRRLHDAAADLRRRLDALRRQLQGAAPDDLDALVTYGTLLARAHRLADHLGAERV